MVHNRFDIQSFLQRIHRRYFRFHRIVLRRRTLAHQLHVRVRVRIHGDALNPTTSAPVVGQIDRRDVVGIEPAPFRSFLVGFRSVEASRLVVVFRSAREVPEREQRQRGGFREHIEEALVFFFVFDSERFVQRAALDRAPREEVVAVLNRVFRSAQDRKPRALLGRLLLYQVVPSDDVVPFVHPSVDPLVLLGRLARFRGLDVVVVVVRQVDDVNGPRADARFLEHVPRRGRGVEDILHRGRRPRKRPEVVQPSDLRMETLRLPDQPGGKKTITKTFRTGITQKKITTHTAFFSVTAPGSRYGKFYSSAELKYLTFSQTY